MQVYVNDYQLENQDTTNSTYGRAFLNQHSNVKTSSINFRNNIPKHIIRGQLRKKQNTNPLIPTELIRGQNFSENGKSQRHNNNYTDYFIKAR
eukprot:Pgem_evm1s2130